jgi:hypothetical protein
MSVIIETQRFPRGEGVWAMLWEIEQEGKGAIVNSEADAKGWTLTATLDSDGAQAKLFAALNERGIVGWHSGGGCRAMAREFGGTYTVEAVPLQILVTGDDANMPEAGGPWVVGCYDDQNEYIDGEEGTGDAEMLAAVDRAIAKMTALAA